MTGMTSPTAAPGLADPTVATRPWLTVHTGAGFSLALIINTGWVGVLNPAARHLDALALAHATQPLLTLATLGLLALAWRLTHVTDPAGALDAGADAPESPAGEVLDPATRAQGLSAAVGIYAGTATALAPILAWTLTRT